MTGRPSRNRQSVGFPAVWIDAEPLTGVETKRFSGCATLLAHQWPGGEHAARARFPDHLNGEFNSGLETQVRQRAGEPAQFVEERLSSDARPCLRDTLSALILRRYK